VALIAPPDENTAANLPSASAVIDVPQGVVKAALVNTVTGVVVPDW
jgi:hypothetical protein